METDVDCMKYRTSTHLARVDIEAAAAEKGNYDEKSKKFYFDATIRLAYFNNGVNVNGKKTDGYFVKFDEFPKEMKINSGNRNKVADIVRITRGLTPVESRNCKNWTGLVVRILADPEIMFGSEKKGGMVIDKTFMPVVTPIDYTEQINKVKACTTMAELGALYGSLKPLEQKAVFDAKEEMKAKLTPPAE